MTAYRFEGYRLDVDRRLLIAGEQVIPLSAKTFGVLQCLVRASGRTVTKDELIAEVWEEQDASDATIVEQIWIVRKLLDQRAANRKYILTVPRRGYQFVPQVSYDSDTVTPTGAIAIGDLLHRSERSVWREYLIATHHAEKRDYSGLKVALKHYNSALSLDRTFAPAWIGIAGVYSNVAFYAFATWDRVLPAALVAIHRAIELDRTSALAHCVLAQIQLARWDVAGSERSLDRAGNLDPQSPAVYQLSSFVRAWRGEPKIALSDAARALALRPSDLSLHGTFSNALASVGDFKNAIASYSKILEIDPCCRIARQGRCEAYVADGELQLALGDLEQLPPTPSNLSRRACVHAFSGDELNATRLLLELQRRSVKEYVEPHCIAQVYIALGRYDEAFHLTERAIARHDLGFPAMSSSPLLHARTKDKRLRLVMGDVRKFCFGPRKKIG